MIFIYFFLPESAGVPLEEMASRFGIDKEVAVEAEKIHIDHNTHDIIVVESNVATKAADITAREEVIHEEIV